MTVLLDAAVRPTANPPRVPAGIGGGDGWMREFHAAGRMAWFHAPNQRIGSDPLAPADQHVAQAPRSADRQPTLSAVPAVPAQPKSPATLDPVRASPERLQGAHAAPVEAPTAKLRPAQPVMDAALGTPVGEANAFPAAALALATRASQLRSPAQRIPLALPTAFVAQTPRQALRVHVEDSPQGLRIWLGVDAAAPAPALRALGVATEIRRLLAASGQRLAAVFCNGELVEAGPLFHSEEP